MTTKERYEGVLGWFAGKMPVAESELKYNDPFELIVAVILSAQCTDKEHDDSGFIRTLSRCKGHGCRDSGGYLSFDQINFLSE